MNTSDLPTTTGAPSQGLDGLRFAGYPVFEPLVMWDLRVTDHPPGVIPWLATDWSADPANRNRWTFHLRQGVRFQDGSRFDADAVIWNLRRFFDKTAAQYEPAGAAWAQSRAPVLKSWEKIDDWTVVIFTSTPTSYFPEVMTSILFASPARWRQVKGDWEAFAAHPSGTGAFEITKVERTAIHMRGNPLYWNRARAPKLDGITLYSMAEGTTRISALHAGEVDWIENPPPDAIPFLHKTGYTVVTSPMPNVWAYYLRVTPQSPFRDVRVRQALNYAMDRDGIVTLLNGAAQPAQGFWKPADIRFGHPVNHYKYDPARAKALLAQAGYPPDKLVPVKILTTATAPGQMLSLPMNELLQQSARKAGFDLQMVVVDASQMAALYNNPKAPRMAGVTAVNKGYNTGEMTYLYYWFYPPNIAGGLDPAAKRLMDEYRLNFDPSKQTKILAALNERLVDAAPMAWVVYDVNPRAFASNIKGYTPAQSWYTDLTTVYMTN
jgi:ABC-type transport system substrate-binding protein